MYPVVNGVVRIGLCLLVATSIFPAVASAGGSLDPASVDEVAESGRWALAIALAFLVVGLPLLFWGLRWLGWIVVGRGKKAEQPSLQWGRSLVVGQDNRVSTSKTTALVWTYTLAGALLSFIVARWLGHPEGFDALGEQGLNAQYAVLIGGPLGAAILAKAVVAGQIDGGSTAKPPADSATPAQLVQNDSGGADLGDLQYLLFNVVALAFFYGEILRVPQAGLPTIPDVLLGLTSVAAVGFVGKKALSGPPTISAVKPTAAAVGERVTIATTGIVKAESDLQAVTVAFGATQVEEGGLEMSATATAGELIEATVPDDAAGAVDLEVSVPTGKKAVWPGFKVVPRITTKEFSGRPGMKIEISTEGVAGLGPKHPGLRVTIDGRAAKVDALRDDTVELKVPEELSPGSYPVVLRTPGGTARADLTVRPLRR